MVQPDLAVLLLFGSLQLVLHILHKIACRLAVWAPSIKHRRGQGVNNVRPSSHMVGTPCCRTISPLKLVI